MRTREDKLYAVALKCAELNNQGCSCVCTLCQFNIFNYVDDVREASLLKANAYTDYQNSKQLTDERKSRESAQTLGPLIFIVILIMFFVGGLKSCFGQEPAQLSDNRHGRESTLIINQAVHLKEFIWQEN